MRLPASFLRLFLWTSVCLLLTAGSASAATLTIQPTTGPIATVITFTGSAPECDEESAEDAEVYVLVGNFAGSAAINPRTTVEVAADGSVSGSWSMPDPASSPAYSGQTTYKVDVRCIDANGVHDTGDITDEANASFTYTPEQCPNLDGPHVSVPAGFFRDAAGNCVPDACPNVDGGQSSVPSGSFTDSSGNCIRDACPNLAGGQATVPAGYGKDAAGQCLRIAITGTNGANSLLGNALANVLSGLGGADVLRGLGGNDTLRAGPGNDHAYGDAGADRIFGDAGADTLVGGIGNDTVVGGPGRDLVHGDSGADSLNAADRAAGDLVVGGSGSDTCIIDAGDAVRSCERVIRRS